MPRATSNRQTLPLCNHSMHQTHPCVPPCAATTPVGAARTSLRRGRKKDHHDPPHIRARILALGREYPILRDAMQHYAGDLPESRVQVLEEFERYIDAEGQPPITSDKQGQKGGSTRFTCQVRCGVKQESPPFTGYVPCGIIKGSLQKIMAHLFSHWNMKPWKCTSCPNRSYRALNELTRHENENHHDTCSEPITILSVIPTQTLVDYGIQGPEIQNVLNTPTNVTQESAYHYSGKINTEVSFINPETLRQEPILPEFFHGERYSSDASLFYSHYDHVGIVAQVWSYVRCSGFHPWNCPPRRGKGKTSSRHSRTPRLLLLLVFLFLAPSSASFWRVYERGLQSIRVCRIPQGVRVMRRAKRISTTCIWNGSGYLVFC